MKDLEQERLETLVTLMQDAGHESPTEFGIGWDGQMEYISVWREVLDPRDSSASYEDISSQELETILLENGFSEEDVYELR